MTRLDAARALFERWNAGGRDEAAVIEYFHPDIEIESPLSALAGEPYRGRAGMDAWLSDIEEQFSEWWISPEELRELGDAILVIASIHARGRASEAPLDFRSAAVLRFGHDEKISRVRIYATVDEALVALGLQG